MTSSIVKIVKQKVEELTDCLSWEWANTDCLLDKVMVVVVIPFLVLGWILSFLPKMHWISK